MDDKDGGDGRACKVYALSSLTCVQLQEQSIQPLDTGSMYEPSSVLPLCLCHRSWQGVMRLQCLPTDTHHS